MCSVLLQIPQHRTHFAGGASALPESSSSDRVPSGSSHLILAPNVLTTLVGVLRDVGTPGLQSHVDKTRI